MTAKTQPTVKLTLRPGPVTPAQKTAWRKFWQKLISEAEANER
jgi:hypothetical protein